MWTSLAKNLKGKFPTKKLVFLYTPSKREVITWEKPYDHSCFLNNADIELVANKLSWVFLKWKYHKEEVFIVDMNAKNLRTWVSNTPEKITYKEDGHNVEVTSREFGIDNPSLAPVLRLTDKEKLEGIKILQSLKLEKAHYICIEPDPKNEFTSNKVWPFENWQRLVDMSTSYFAENDLKIKFLQVGSPTAKTLTGVLSSIGQGTFREASFLIEKSLFLIGTMGGLVHAAKSFNKKSIVLVSAYEPLAYAAYPDDINLYTDIECKNCGLRVPCPIGIKCMTDISIEQVFKKLKVMVSATIA